MKIRTAEHLQDRLDSDLIWRKKELTVLGFLVAKASPDRRVILLRAAVTLIYAHWEGFIKTASSAYLEYIARLGLKNRELNPTFVALSARGKLRRFGPSSKASDHIALVQFFLQGMDESNQVPYKDGIGTKSNLSSSVLLEIVTSLALDFTPFETKTHLIDERLLKDRNSIAHGEYLLIDEGSVAELAGEVIGMLEIFRAQIGNAAILGHFRASGPLRSPS